MSTTAAPSATPAAKPDTKVTTVSKTPVKEDSAAGTVLSIVFGAGLPFLLFWIFFFLIVILRKRNKNRYEAVTAKTYPVSAV